MKMSYRKKNGILLTFFTALLLFGFLHTNADPMWLPGFILIFISIFLFFTKEQVFNSWKKFAIWYIPISAILIFLSPTGHSSGLGGPSLAIDREAATMFLSGLYLIISLLIITIKSISLRNQEKKQKLN